MEITIQINSARDHVRPPLGHGFNGIQLDSLTGTHGQTCSVSHLLEIFETH